MMSKTNTVNLDPRENPRSTTLNPISLLSPDIYDSSSLSRSTISVTHGNMNPNKRSFTETRKVPKNYHGDKSSYPKKSDSHEKELDNNY